MNIFMAKFSENFKACGSLCRAKGIFEVEAGATTWEGWSFKQARKAVVMAKASRKVPIPNCRSRRKTSKSDLACFRRRWLTSLWAQAVQSAGRVCSWRWSGHESTARRLFSDGGGSGSSELFQLSNLQRLQLCIF